MQLILALLLVIMFLAVLLVLATWLGLPAGITATILLLGAAAITGFGLATAVAVVLTVVNDTCASGHMVSCKHSSGAHCHRHGGSNACVLPELSVYCVPDHRVRE
jgi:hypothetical protein